MLENGAESHQSAARFVGLLFGLQGEFIMRISTCL
jgi:hypothetical protein